MKRFRNLTKSQFRVLGDISIGWDGGHHPKTLAKLEAMGLIVGRAEPVHIRRYELPLSVHREWCQWCADNSPDDVCGHVEGSRK